MAGALGLWLARMVTSRTFEANELELEQDIKAIRELLDELQAKG